jgi:hypothetical protein
MPDHGRDESGRSGGRIALPMYSLVNRLVRICSLHEPRQNRHSLFVRLSQELAHGPALSTKGVPVQDRRRFLTAFALLLAATPLLQLLGAGAITQVGKNYVVNGWVLTEQDLEALDRHFSAL